jgi:hypothetical protein
MRNLTVNTTRIMMAVALLAASAAVVSADDERIVATVPFDFIAGGAHLPAGKYVVKPGSIDPSVVAIESADGRQTAYALTVPMSWNLPVRQPELVFDKRDNQYVLARLVAADGSEREIPGKRPTIERGIAAASEVP